MSTTLYRKYRPQKFSELTNQNHVKVTLGNEVARGSTAHAYLFSGARGVGKTTSARILAKAVNCSARKPGEGEPCNACPACESITAGRALDVIEIDAASNTGVDHVREQIIEHARFAPALLPVKVFIIDEVHMLSASAFNALLKTLEEPPPRVMFILATTELHKVPETVISRCQRFDFHKLNVADLVERLAHLAVEEGVTVDRRVLDRIARTADGSVRDAESMFGQVLALGGKEVTDDMVSLVLPHSDVGLAREFLEAAARGDASGAFSVVGKLIEGGVDVPQFATDAIAELRALLHAHLSVGIEGSFDRDENARRFAERMQPLASLPRVARMLEEMISARAASKEPDAGTLPLELAAVRLAEMTGSSPLNLPPASQGGEKDKRFSPLGEGGEKKEGGSSVSLTLDAITSRWNQVVAAVQGDNHSLPIVLVGARPLRIADGMVTIGVSHQFHVSKLLEEKNRRLIESAITKVCGTPLRFNAEVTAAGGPAAAAVAADDAAVRQALDVFGGQIVE